jgi:hypothetical protein
MPGGGLKIVGAEGLGARFKFNFGEDGSQAGLIIPVEPDGCEERESFRRTPERAAHFAPAVEQKQPWQKISMNRSTTFDQCSKVSIR